MAEVDDNDKAPAPAPAPAPVTAPVTAPAPAPVPVPAPAPADNLDDRRDLKDDKPSTENDASQLLPPRRRGDRDSRERKDEKDLDRHPPRRPPGDYYDRNRSPPPRHPIRDRDYKRRLSASPPPPYRDRRHSPPRRSSPLPPFKRSRRDDGGYDRRGSPRGGYGHGNRRFANDYANERDMGGRLNYGNDRPRGQYFGRVSDWDVDHGEYNDGGNMDNAHRQGLMSYKQFIQELEDDILPSEAERRYQEYKSEYITTMKQTYFDAHKDEEWFKDKYHPTNLPAVIERRNERAKKAAEDFLNDLQNGTLDLNPGVKAMLANRSEQTSEPNADNEVNDGGKRTRHGRVSSKDDDLISSAPKAHTVSSDPRRIQIDIEQGLGLLKKLDLEKKIDENILSRADCDKSNGSSSGPVVIVRSLASVKGLEGIELLDTILTYLWRIHGVDYYGLVESSEPKGLRHVRHDGKSSAAAPNGSEWEKKIDSYWQERLKGQDPLEVRACREKLDAAATNLLDPSVRKIRDEKYGWKYGCGAKGCTKLFHAAEFVYKHLKLKHTDLVGELTNKLREDFYLENYMNDADAPGGTPIMQQPKSREKPGQQRRRLGMEHRLKDDRGNQMEFDNQDHRGSYDGGKQDEMMFDSSSGQGGGLNDAASAFPSDGPPPPVLMPVPGAGPLGPFVPAPPEVAMRMMREQGGPPFGVNGRNNGQSGPSPIIALPPSFRQDPRRLRSYQDLDAPDDEVTVIDYRSL